jgi:hypothetical protein
MPRNIRQELQHPPIWHGVLQVPDRARRNPCFVSPASPCVRVKASKTFASPMPGLPVVWVRDDSVCFANTRSRPHRLHTGTTRRAPRQRHRGFPVRSWCTTRASGSPFGVCSSTAVLRSGHAPFAQCTYNGEPAETRQRLPAADQEDRASSKAPNATGPMASPTRTPAAQHLAERIPAPATTGTGDVPGSKEFSGCPNPGPRHSAA